MLKVAFDAQLRLDENAGNESAGKQILRYSLTFNASLHQKNTNQVYCIHGVHNLSNDETIYSIQPDEITLN
jgi:hypothetical protein